MWIIILGVLRCIFTCEFAFKTKRAMCHEVKKTRSLKVRCYVERLVDLNQYFASFPGATLAYKIYVIGLNEILLNKMNDRWSKQAYVQGFD